MRNSKLIPYSRIRKFLKDNVNGECISSEAVEYLQLVLENQLKFLCKCAVEDLEKTNSIRKLAGLPEQKRITVSQFKSLSTKSYNETEDCIVGERGQINKDTRLSKADMEVT